MLQVWRSIVYSLEFVSSENHRTRYNFQYSDRVKLSHTIFVPSASNTHFEAKVYMDAATIAMRPVELFYIYGSDVGVGAYGPPVVANLVVWSGGS